VAEVETYFDVGLMYAILISLFLLLLALIVPRLTLP